MLPNLTEAANRGEATSLLIRAGWRVYRPEADVHGEDLVLRCPEGRLLAVQQKGCPEVDRKKYAGKDLWLLFPDPKSIPGRRPWYLLPHDVLLKYFADRHPGTGSIAKGIWTETVMVSHLQGFLDEKAVRFDPPTA